MTTPVPQGTEQSQEKVDNKELNFRRQQQMYERQIEQERAARIEAENKYKEAQARLTKPADDDDDTEPYIDKKRLKNSLNQFGQETKTDIQKAMEVAKHQAKEELKQELWLEQHPDFAEVLTHAEKFAQKAPKLADSILRMPEGFERQKLVYENIKQLGINLPEQKQSTVQDKIDANKRSPYYHPSGIGTPPPSMGGDFSRVGQKNAYDKMQELKNKLRL
jgi:hypothetical protein